MATVSLSSFPQKETVECPHCHSSIVLYDPRGSEFCACSFCQSHLQFIDEVPKKVGSFSAPRSKALIPLGAEGVLKGTTFKVIAFLEKEENAQYGWREYLLYNYEKGYATLSEFDGHWNVIYGNNFLPKLDKVLYGNDYIMYDDVEYRLFHKYNPKVVSLSGELDWDIKKEFLQVSEFIAPPFIISREKGREKHSHADHYRGEYLEPKEIAAAFGLDPAGFPPQTGIVSNQPSATGDQWLWSFRAALLMLLAIFVVQFFLVVTKPEKVVFNESLELAYDPQKGVNEFKPVMSPSFELMDESASLDLEMTASVTNNWLEATIVLVNEKTNQTWEVTKGVEFYEGVEGGEHWTEGSRSTAVLLSEIPAGTYHLNVYPASDSPLSNSMSVKITANEVIWRNIFAALIVLSILPLIAFVRVRHFEQKRWSNSNYSPYNQ